MFSALGAAKKKKYEYSTTKLLVVKPEERWWKQCFYERVHVDSAYSEAYSYSLEEREKTRCELQNRLVEKLKAAQIEEARERKEWERR